VHVGQGEIVGLLGPNGAGKTTSFYMMLVLSANEGNIFWMIATSLGLPMYQRAKLGIGYLAQEASVFRKLPLKKSPGASRDA